MSNYLAVATTTSVLKALMTEAAQVVSGAEAFTVRPPALVGAPPPAIYVYLYQVMPNPAWRNADLPTRTSGGRLSQRPQAAFDLHYLLSFYGNENQLEPQRLLGSALSVLHAKPVLSRELVQGVIDAALASDPNHFLGDSNLADQIDVVRLSPLALTLDDLSKLWATFLQTPYAPSVGYVASVVLIEPSATAQPSLPVRRRSLLALPVNHPVIERAVSTDGPDQPILAGGDVLLLGQRLNGPELHVLFGEVEQTPDADDISDTQVKVTLPGSLRAGVQGVQVAHRYPLGDPAVPHRGVLSNLAAFVLRPTITKTGGIYDIAFSDRVAAGDGTLSGKITISFDPQVGKAQRVALLLNEFHPAGTPAAYRFDATPRLADGPSVDFAISGVLPHQYLVRVQIDGAETLLDVDTNSANPTFNEYIGPVKNIV